MFNLKAFIFIIFTLPCFVLCAQNRKVDSLLQQLPLVKDTLKVNILNQLSKQHWFSEPKKTMYYAKEAIKLSSEIDFQKGISSAYNNMGVSYYLQNDYANALKYYGQSMQIHEKSGNQKGVGDALNNMGLVYEKQSNYPRAVEYYLKSMKIFEQRNDLGDVASLLMNIGNVYDGQEDYTQALTYYKKALAIGEKITLEEGLPALLLNNLGIVYLHLKRYPESLQHLLQALKKREIDDKEGRGITLSNIGLNYLATENYQEALKYLSEALALQQALDNKDDMLSTLQGMATVYQKTKDYAKSETYAKQSLQLAQQVEAKDRTASAYKMLAEVSDLQNKHQQAYQYHVRYTQTKDSILNDENNRKIARLQANYETEKKQVEIELLKEEKALSAMLRNLFGVALASSVIIGGLIFSRQRSKSRNEKALIEKDKQILLTQQALSEAEIANNIIKEKQLQQELEYRNKALTTHTLNLIQKNSIMEEIRETISEVLKSPLRNENSPVFSRLIKLIDYSFNLDKDWHEFKIYFEGVHKDFFVKLKEAHPDLSSGELRLCALVRLNLNAKESATILSISPDSVKTARHRLRKKLNLPEEHTMADYLISI